ncbi:class I SAM-dependent methyltransferase [Aneurinibacillus aneurinilyticus]|uniref:class I SAM-dependent methyltransferase n=1 Tax=Aneurinibacillus aneurinilyticus TaxID=1391 RepID=UPI003523FF3F
MIYPRLQFLTQFLKYPRTIGSITPSSSFLAKAMVTPVSWEDTEVVVELGAGTGIFTKYIEQNMKPASRAYIFEKNLPLQKKLKQRYPAFSHYTDAKNMSAVLCETGEKSADVIISGLPFTVFPKELTTQIMNEVIKSLKPGGLFITFQYSLHMKKRLQADFSTIELRFVPFNIPPAFVYICRK